MTSSFEWDDSKNIINREKHGVSFYTAQLAFMDRSRVVICDEDHSNDIERRYYCIGKVEGEVLTVRFTNRDYKIRIIGAGYWRRGKKIYEQEQSKV